MQTLKVARSEDVKENEVLAVKAGSESVLLTRVGGVARAVAAKCPHLGLSMAKGKVENGAITCPWHGSRFDVCSGESLDWCNAVAGLPMPGWSHRLLAMGKKPAPVPTYETSEENGAVFLRVPG